MGAGRASRRSTARSKTTPSRAAPNLTVERLIEEGDTVVAPHFGEGRLRGGDAFRFAGVTVFGFDGDLISRVESYIVPLQG